MIKHIVCWTLKEFAENNSALENAKIMKKEGEALMGKIEGLLSIELSYNLLDSTTLDAQLVLQTVHSSKEALAEYQKYPDHVALGEFAKKVVSSRVAIDYEI